MAHQEHMEPSIYLYEVRVRKHGIAGNTTRNPWLLQGSLIPCWDGRMTTCRPPQMRHRCSARLPPLFAIRFRSGLISPGTGTLGFDDWPAIGPPDSTRQVSSRLSSIRPLGNAPTSARDNPDSCPQPQLGCHQTNDFSPLAPPSIPYS